MNKNQVITLPFNDEIVEKSLDNAIKKLYYTMSNLMYNRPPVEIFDNIIMGDIAKNSILYYLRSKCLKPIVDYDEIREDNFKKPDPGWDFQFGKTQLKVEVKSSIPTKGESVDDIIKLRDIKITASHDKGRTYLPVNEIIADIHLQVYFYATTYRNGYTTLQQLYDDIKNDKKKAKTIININKYKEPLYLGWNTKENIKKYVNELRPNTWTFSWTDRIYWRCPLTQAKDIEELIGLINSTD